MRHFVSQERVVVQERIIGHNRLARSERRRRGESELQNGGRIDKAPESMIWGREEDTIEPGGPLPEKVGQRTDQPTIVCRDLR